jgi:uncharacterized membrane-anchored protein YitT (DUF2179 family)
MSKQVMTQRLSMRMLPPARYFVGAVLLAVVVVDLEKASHISSGGVGGLSIALSQVFGISVGLANMLIKGVIFAVVFWGGGLHLGVWTIISTLISGVCMWMLESMPLPFVWNPWLAFVCIMMFSAAPMGLMLSKGYSTGGFSSIAQVLWTKKKVPLWMTILVLNAASIVSMYISYGVLAGMLTLVATLWSGFSTELWTRWFSRLLGGVEGEHGRQNGIAC